MKLTANESASEIKSKREFHAVVNGDAPKSKSFALGFPVSLRNGKSEFLLPKAFQSNSFRFKFVSNFPFETSSDSQR